MICLGAGFIPDSYIEKIGYSRQTWRIGTPKILSILVCLESRREHISGYIYGMLGYNSKMLIKASRNSANKQKRDENTKDKENSHFDSLK